MVCVIDDKYDNDINNRGGNDSKYANNENSSELCDWYKFEATTIHLDFLLFL